MGKESIRRAQKYAKAFVGNNMKTVIIGDVHGYFDKLNALLRKLDYPEYILCCGDFGYWPLGNRFLHSIYTGKSKIYFCDGNHENHNQLRRLENIHGWEKPIEVSDNIFFMPRGSILNINGKKMLFMGGAESIDKHLRREGWDWFKEESITTAQVNRLREEKINIVISHAAPRFVLNSMENKELQKTRNKTPILLEYVYNLYKPKYWYYGHYHTSYREKIGDTWFYCLNRLNDIGCNLTLK